MAAILDLAKKYVGVAEGDTTFDPVLLVLLRSGYSSLSLIGVSELDGVVVDETTVLTTRSSQLDSLCQSYLLALALKNFGPTTSATISASIQLMIDNCVSQIHILANHKEVAQ